MLLLWAKQSAMKSQIPFQNFVPVLPFWSGFSQNFWEVQELLRASWIRFQDLVSFTDSNMKKRGELLCFDVWFYLFNHAALWVGTNTSAEVFGLDTDGLVKSNESLI